MSMPHRYALNIKGLEYKTKWIQFPDVEPVLKKLGAVPTTKKPDGSDMYTLPTIYDPNTKEVVSDSFVIAQYLDETYPDTHKLIPAGTDALQAAYHDFIWSSEVGVPFFMVLMAATCGRLLSPSSEYVRTTREPLFGVKLEELSTEEQWKKVEAGLDKLNSYLEKNGKGNDLLILGAQNGITFSDLQLAGLFMWAKVALGENSEKFKMLLGLNGGKWGRFFAQFSKYEHVDF